MNLHGKYIEIDRNNIEYVITLLYSIGYEWTIGKCLNHTLDGYKNFTNETGKSYIRIHINDDQFIFLHHIPDDNIYTYFNINILLREYKLKRILK